MSIPGCGFSNVWQRDSHQLMAVDRLALMSAIARWRSCAKPVAAVERDAGVTGSGTREMRAELQRAAFSEPDAVESQVGLLGEQVVVAVVVKDPEAVDICDRGDDDVDGRQPMMTHARKLPLRVDRAKLDTRVDVDLRQREKLVDQLLVRSAIAR